MHTRALRQGRLHDLGNIVARAGLGGAVTDTVLVVLVVAQAGHVVGLASQLGRLGVHVGDAHLLSDMSVRSLPRVQKRKKILTAHCELDMPAAVTVLAASRAIAMGEKDFIVLVERGFVR